MTSPLSPSRLPQRSEHRRAFQNPDLQLLQGESVSACGQTLTVREVGMDWQVCCGCGWASIPVVALGLVRCEACDTLAEGRRRSGFTRDSIVAGLRLQNLMWHAIHAERND